MAASSLSIFQLPSNHFCHHSRPLQLNKFTFLRFCSQQQLTSCPPTQLQNNQLIVSNIKQDRLEDARIVFDNMPERDEVSWSTIISAYTRCGNYSEVLNLFEKMLREGLKPDELILECLFEAISGVREVLICRQLHGWLLGSGTGLTVNIFTSLITMYSNCGFMHEARRIFEEVPLSYLEDVSLWNSMFSVYVFHECWDEAFRLIGEMMSSGVVVLTERFYASIINACSNARMEKYGKIIHGRIVKYGMVDVIIIGNSLVTFYSKCGDIEDANRFFGSMSSKDVVSWNSIIAGNEQNGEYENAISLFHGMLKAGILVRPNRITFLSVLSAISRASDLKYGRAVHAYIIRSGLECNTTLVNALVTMYSNCKEVGKAKLIFEVAPFKDMISWNSMLSAYEQNEKLISFFELFRKMLLSGIKPDNHSFTVVLSATSSLPLELKYLSDGRACHCYILRRTSLGRMGISTCNAILNMYAKNNRIADAENVFSTMTEKDTYTWNTMMDGYSLDSSFDEAFQTFLEMHGQGLPLDYMTFSILLTVCSRMVSFHLGEQSHAFIVKHIDHHGFSEPTSLLSIQNALISMYAKCGSIRGADRVFTRMKVRDVFSWTAMITGYAHHGLAIECFKLFEKMKEDAIKPNNVTFLGLLTACAHVGLVEEGIYYFHSMSQVHGLSPRIEHYACMVDLFGRSGQLEQAENLVEVGLIHFKKNRADCLKLWKVLLGACHAHKKLAIGVHAATAILELEPQDETTHVLLLNLYAALGMWDDAMKVRRWMKEKGLKKQEMGFSWIEAGNKRHIFVAGDISHPQRKDIYVKLEEVSRGCRQIGYVPMTEYVLQDVDESQKEAIVCCHSEKLAVSFGLLQSGHGGKGLIRVIKNLRICGDCHNWMKFCSQFEKREIVLRDSRRFHLFKDGNCSCRDYW